MAFPKLLLSLVLISTLEAVWIGTLALDPQYIGRTAAKANIFMDTTQRSQAESRKYCLEHGYDLIQINPDVNDTLLEDKIIAKLGENAFWTSGMQTASLGYEISGFQWVGNTTNTTISDTATLFKYGNIPDPPGVCLLYHTFNDTGFTGLYYRDCSAKRAVLCWEE